MRAQNFSELPCNTSTTALYENVEIVERFAKKEIASNRSGGLHPVRPNILSVPKFTANLYCICLSVPQIYTQADVAQICGKFWDTQCEGRKDRAFESGFSSVGSDPQACSRPCLYYD